MSGYRSAALLVFNTLVLLILLEAGSAVALRVWPAGGPTITDETPSYYKNEEWGGAFLRTEKNVIDQVAYAPYVMWRTKPHQGTYVRVDKDGRRETPGVNCGPNAYKVFIFGGSTIWGDGVPDWGTIPAYVQGELTRTRQTAVCVRNFGQPGWVSGQSVIELTGSLQAGDVPDLAIFYDGFNDVGVLWSGGAVGGPYDTNGFRERLEAHGIRQALVEVVVWTHMFRALERLVPSVHALRDWPRNYHPPDVDTSAATAAIVRAYLSNYTTVKALAGAYRFEFAMFWQPSLHYTSRKVTAEEQSLAEAERAERPGMPELLRSVYDRIKIEGRGLDRFFMVADAFEKTDQGVYLDGVHLTHNGNRAIAMRITETVARGRLP